MESLILGRDCDVLNAMIPFYGGDSCRILDVACNRRKSWKGVDPAILSRVIFCDVDGSMGPDVICDWSHLPFPDGSFGVLIFDPPHLPVAAASPMSKQQMVRDYGLARSCVGDNVSSLFLGAMREAARVLTLDGVVIAKIKDYVHNHRYQWNLHHLNGTARSVGMTPCDLVIKRDPSGGSLKSSRWKNSHHARNVHSYFPVYRKGKCEPSRRKSWHSTTTSRIG